MNHQNKTTPVIAMTANAVKGAKEMYLQHGFADYISKPIFEEKLWEILEKFLPDLAGKTEQQESPDIEKETALQEHFPYLNTKFGMSICMNDEAFYLKMLKVYIEDEMSDILQKDYQAEDWVQYEVHVHGMKMYLPILVHWSCQSILRDWNMQSKGKIFQIRIISEIIMIW